MKIAILGGSPIALEAALRFHLHGAALTWYKDPDEFSHFQSVAPSAQNYVSELGQGILREFIKNDLPKIFTWKEWTETYELPLTEFLKSHQEVKSDEVISVSKRFLSPGEMIPGKSRFFDLFRVIFRVNPREFIDEQKDTNPETYKRLTDEFVHSLASTIEMYQDYDLVLDLRSDMKKASIAASGRALGEGRPCSKISYGLSAFEFTQKLVPSPDFREICLVGSDSLSAEILLSMEDWVKELHSRLFIVSTEEDPFSHYLKVADPKVAERLQKLFLHLDNEFQGEITRFTTKLREWQELDDFVQAKIPKPSEPIPRLVFFSGHNVTAIDELIDRKRMFVTLERPEFRAGKKHPENNNLDLKTIGVDHILVGHGKKDFSLIELDHNEQGFFNLAPSRPNIQNGWEKDLSQLEGIEDEIFKLFSPTNTH